MTQFNARWRVSPWGHEALVEQLAIYVVWILRTLGASEVDLEDLLYRPYWSEQRDREPDELSEEEIAERHRADELVFEEYRQAMGRAETRRFDERPLPPRASEL